MNPQTQSKLTKQAPEVFWAHTCTRCYTSSSQSLIQRRIFNAPTYRPCMLIISTRAQTRLCFSSPSGPAQIQPSNSDRHIYWSNLSSALQDAVETTSFQRHFGASTNGPAKAGTTKISETIKTRTGSKQYIYSTYDCLGFFFSNWERWKDDVQGPSLWTITINIKASNRPSSEL